jgi:hypothetical protein
MNDWLGAGGAGAGAAIATVGTEAAVVALMLAAVGRRLFDARLRRVLLRTAAVCLGVLACHLALGPLGAWRLAADAVAYLSLALILRAVDVREVADFVRTLRQARAPSGDFPTSER